MSRLSTVTTRERKTQAAMICREIESREGKQERHAHTFQEEKLTSFT